MIYEFTELELFRRHPGLRDQLERAALSISNNIAEGFERGTTNELLAFLYIARGSAGEVRSMLTILAGWRKFSDLKSQGQKRKNIEATVWLDRELKEFGDRRPAPAGRKGKEPLREQKSAGVVPGRTPPNF